MMILTKFFLKNVSFINKSKKVFFLKSKNGNQPFRQSLYNTSLICFCAKNSIFGNVKFYKNFDLYNYYYYTYLLRNQLKTSH